LQILSSRMLELGQEVGFQSPVPLCGLRWLSPRWISTEAELLFWKGKETQAAVSAHHHTSMQKCTKLFCCTNSLPYMHYLPSRCVATANWAQLYSLYSTCFARMGQKKLQEPQNN
jgi:hypothetical protein